MATHELECFRETAGLPEGALDIHAMMTGKPHRDELQRYDAVFFGGSGAYSVLDDSDWIRASVDALLDVVDLKIPAYASCFGFQGLTVALGGSVIHDESKTEMGSTAVFLTDSGQTDPLFGKLPQRFWVQEGHHDRAERLPDGVDLVVAGDFVYEQAFRVKGAPFWASQFHPELTLAKTIDRFYHYAEYYMDPAEADARLEVLRGGLETPEVGSILSRLVRGEF